MNIIQPCLYVEKQDEAKILRKIEHAGRICYKTEGKAEDGTYHEFLRKRIDTGHLSVVEHDMISTLWVCDRGISHEAVRHRMASFSQESTRYCNYSKDGFGKAITVIEPLFFDQGSLDYDTWRDGCEYSESTYMDLLDNGRTAQEARSVLPNSLKTEFMMSANLREWRLVCSLRADKAAHPQMKQLAIPLLWYFKAHYAPLFDDISYDQAFASQYVDKLAKVIEVEEFKEVV